MGHDVKSDPAYGYTAHLDGVSFDAARARVTDALKEQGFGVLTEIDVKATMKAKLDVEFRKYTILGACNPPLAHKALAAETKVGVLLPCNLIVFETGPRNSTVAAIDPIVQLGKTGIVELTSFATEIRSRLIRVLEAVAAV
jgi:uncharacterized protein (DUF302 family)